MRNLGWKVLCWGGLVMALVAGGCSGNRAREADAATLLPQSDLGPTIGSVAVLVRPAPVVVEGYGLVGGLPGTGSAYCPPQLRAYLKQYILAQLPTERANLDALIDDMSTAVVRLEGVLPPTPSMDDRFDVRVSLIPGSEATSVHGGWLYRSELVRMGTFGVDTRPLATVEGPVFINSIGTVNPDTRTGFVLGGGRARQEYVAMLQLRRPDPQMANVVRNRLTERYGPTVVRSVSPSGIELRIPPEYRLRKERFIAMVPTTYLEVTNELTTARVNTFVHQLAVGEDKDEAEHAVEALGRESLGRLGVLLRTSDPEVRLRAARCMLGLGDDRGLLPLRELALNSKSPHRIEALDAVMVSAKRNDALALARRLLRDEDVTIMLAAYEHLRRMEDPTIRQELIGRSFQLEQVMQTNRRVIFVSRSGEPRVVLFGAPLECTNDVFVESPDQTIVVNARRDQDHVSITRKHPTRSGIMGPLRAGFEVGSIVRILGADATATPQGQLQGLGVSYGDIIAILQQLSARDAVDARFLAGPLPKIGHTVKR